MPKKTVGIVIGGGSGSVLAKIFETCLGAILGQHGIPFSFVHSEESRIFSSYEGIKKYDDPKARSQEESARLEKLYGQWKEAGIGVVFRTSINAEALYEFRSKTGGIKEFGIDTTLGSRIQVVRDMAEGYYANTSYTLDNDGTTRAISYEGTYTYARLRVLLLHAVALGEEACQRKDYANNTNFEIWLVYKYHLFSGVFEQWLDAFFDQHPDLLAWRDRIKLYQPDTGFTELFRFARYDKRKYLAVICSNEIGDLLYEPLIDSIQGVADKLQLYSLCRYFPPDFAFHEYQTVHGSADDKMEGGEEDCKVLPYATLRIAAAIAECHFGVANCRQAMDEIVTETILHFYDRKGDDCPSVAETIKHIYVLLHTKQLIGLTKTECYEYQEC